MEASHELRGHCALGPTEAAKRTPCRHPTWPSQMPAKTATNGELKACSSPSIPTPPRARACPRALPTTTTPPRGDTPTHPPIKHKCEREGASPSVSALE